MDLYVVILIIDLLTLTIASLIIIDITPTRIAAFAPPNNIHIWISIFCKLLWNNSVVNQTESLIL